MRSPHSIWKQFSASLQNRAVCHLATVFCTAKYSSFSAASSLGNEPCVFTALRNLLCSHSTAFVVYVMRRTSGGNEKNGTTCSPFSRHSFAMAGYFDHLVVNSATSCSGLRRGRRSIHWLQIRHRLLAVFLHHVIQTRTHQVRNAQSHLRLRIHRFNRLRKALQSIHARQQNIFHAAVAQLCQHPLLLAR